MSARLMLATIAAFLVSALLSKILSRYRGRWALLDVPNQRSLHAIAKPRSGGIAILAGLLLGATATGFPGFMKWEELLALAPSGLDGIHGRSIVHILHMPVMTWTLIALALVAVISLADDIWRLPAWARLFVHALAALVLVLQGGFALGSLHLLPGWDWHAPTWLLVLVSVLLTIWLINLYNFMDGMDGLAGGMAVFGFGTLALMGWIASDGSYATTALMVAAAAAGFLLFNFPPARLFMGDVGSGSLGLLAAAMLLWADQAGLFPLWIGALPFAPFIVDATWTVIRRTAQGKRPWQAHKEHFYQRLVQLGWSHRRVVLVEYILMLNCSLLAVGCLCFTAIGVQGVLLGEMVVVIAMLIAGINVLERRRD